MSIISMHEERRRRIHAALDQALKELVELDHVMPHQIVVALNARGHDVMVTLTFTARFDPPGSPRAPLVP